MASLPVVRRAVGSTRFAVLAAATIAALVQAVPGSAADPARGVSPFDGPGRRWAVRADDSNGAPRTIRGIQGVTLAGWNEDRRAAVEALFEQDAARFRLRPGVDRFVVVRERARRGMHHLRAEQRYRGIPVFRGEYAVSVGAGGDLRMIAGRAISDVRVSTTPLRSREQALHPVRAALGAPVEAFATRLVVFRDARGADHLAWEIKVENPFTHRQHLALVDAHDLEVLETHDLSYDLEGRGNVYPVNARDPMSFVERTLPRLEGPTQLVGEFAAVHNGNGSDAVGIGGAFLFDTTQTTELSQSNVYWHVDHFLERLRDLGYDEPVRVRADVNGIDPPNSCSVAFANPAAQAIYLFPECLRVSRNTALAADVIYHETQHVVLASYDIWGTDYESRALHEAYSDYMACAITDDPHMAEWSIIPCDRNVEHGGAARWLDSDPKVFHYSRRDSVFGCHAGYQSPHSVGIILASAMWDVRRAIGPVADRLAIEALDYLPQTPDFGCVADAMLQAAMDHHGGRHGLAVLRGFLDRGIRGAAEVEIVGPSSIELPALGTFQASDCCGVAVGSHTWSARPACDTGTCPEWVEVGHGPTLTYVGEGDFDLRLVSDDRWGRSAQAVQRVTVFLGPPPTIRFTSTLGCWQAPSNGTALYTAEATGIGLGPIRWSGYDMFSGQERELGTGESLSYPCRTVRVDPIEVRVTDAHGRTVMARKYAWTSPNGAAWALGLVSNQDGRSVFAIDAPLPGVAELAIFDAAGRVVARPWNGALASGRTTVEWTHDSSRPGLYFARLTTPAGTRTRKLVLLSE